jgi:hypothetical protein
MCDRSGQFGFGETILGRPTQMRGQFVSPTQRDQGRDSY